MVDPASAAHAGDGIPAISLWQPWASLIAAGAKPFETRGWIAPGRFIGRRIAIHAAKHRVSLGLVTEMDAAVLPILGSRWWQRLPAGAIVCTALLAGCYRVTGTRGGAPVLEDGRAIRDDGFGDYEIGRWCWELKAVEPLTPAAAAKGHQGFWTWTP